MHQRDPLPLTLTFKSQSVEQVREQRVLGVKIDDQLCWHNHIENTCKKISKNLFLLSKIRPFTDEPTRKLFYLAHIQPHIDYASSVWDGASEDSLKRLNSLHRRAIKLVADRVENGLTTDQKFQHLGILPLQQQFEFNKLVQIYKIILGNAPTYLNPLVTPSRRQNTALRNRLILPKPRIDLYKTSFAFSAAKLWNDLPNEITSSGSTNTFKARLLRHMTAKNRGIT